MSDPSPRCPRCGGRLFLGSEFQGRRLLYFWECSLGCSRQFDMNVRLIAHSPVARRDSPSRELVPAV